MAATLLGSTDRYTIHDRIGAGGMATVHLGRVRGAAGFARTVAIKRLGSHVAHDAGCATALVDEARLVALLHHPNVVSIVDVVREPGELSLVLEYVHGLSLRELMQRATAQHALPSAPVSVAIVLGVLSGLHAAHEARDAQGAPLEIVHRDVCPANVLLGEDGVARLIDFGIASARKRLGATAPGQLKGTLAYLAPEQLEGAPATRRSDVYGAGVLLWELLSGVRLFAGEHEGHVLEQVRLGWIDPPSKHRPSIPEPLEQVVLRALSRDPLRRFESARALADALTFALAPAPLAEVGDWVAKLSGDELAARAARLQQICAEEAAPDRTRRARAPGLRSLLALGLLLAALTALATLVLLHLRAPAAPPSLASSAAPRPPPSTRVVIPTSPAVVPAVLAPEPSAASASTPNAAAAPTHGAAPPRAKRSQRRERAAAHGCNPPYAIDGRGILLFKRECLASP